MEEVVIDSLLGADIYVTLKGQWKGKPVASDLNNEYNLMGHPVLRTVASEALLHSSPWKWGLPSPRGTMASLRVH